MKKLFVLVGSLSLWACTNNTNPTASSASSAPNQDDVERVKNKFSGYTLAELTEGKMLYEKNCGNCHKLYSPNSEKEEDWKNIVPDMVKKTNRKAGTEVINPAEQEKILRYVITIGSR